MEKHRKLKKYQRKDYSQTVDFPVEIVGRDGVVRTYSFEESIRLYQRRISSAAARYTDAEIVDAEIGHCRQRIRQLRRSYYDRYGWDGIRVLESTGGLEPAVAGEMAAFLCRRAAQWFEHPDRIVFTHLESESGYQVYSLTMAGTDQLALLYVHQFHWEPGNNDPVCEARAAFEQSLQLLRSRPPNHTDAEHLLAWHDTEDLGLILTGRNGAGTVAGTEAHDQVDWRELVLPAAAGNLRRENDHNLGMAALSCGEFENALRLLRQAAEDHPDQTSTLLGICVAAGMLGRDSEAEFYARMGVRLHPEDPVMHHHLALALLRQQRLSEAARALEAALGIDPHRFEIRFLEVLVALRRGHLWRAWRMLRRQKDSRQDRFRDLRALVPRLAVLRSASWLASAGLVLLPLAALGLYREQDWGWWALGGGILAAVGSRLTRFFHQRLLDRFSRHHRLVLPVSLAETLRARKAELPH